jgi:nickel transport protein
MTKIQKCLAMSVLCLFLAGLPGTSWAQSPPDENDQEVISLLKEQNSKLSGDLRRIQREIAALRADLEKPGMKDVFAGIGYIFGLFGVAAFVAARRKE